MRYTWLGILCWFGSGFWVNAQTRSSVNTLEQSIDMLVRRGLSARPLPHPVIFKVSQVSKQETPVGKVQEGTLTWSYTWFRLTPAQDTLPVFTHTQKLQYKRTQPWEEAWATVGNSVSNATMQYARAWWTRNGAGSPALIDSVRLVWLPEMAIQDPDTLYYPTKRLDWKDFQGAPSFRSRFGAEIFTSMGFSLQMEVKNHCLIIQLQGKCYMVRGISWVKSSSATPYALAHEQLHFDITHRSLLYWMKLVNDLPTFWHPDDWSAGIQQAYLQAFRQMNAWQKEYDAETMHGQNTLQQAKWEAQFKFDGRD